MKRWFLIPLLLLGTLTLHAQGPLDAFAGQLASGEVTFKYSFEVQGDVPLKGSGQASLQGPCYHVFGNGLDIWCDGKTRWTIDQSAREAYVEAVEVESSDYLDNPATLLSSLSSAFEIDGDKEVTLGGKRLREVLLTPVLEDTGLQRVILYLDGAVPARVSITVEDGTKTLFRLSDYAVHQKSGAAYSFDTASLGSDYVVTDLR